MGPDIIDRAIDPNQYDLDDLEWEKESQADSSRIAFFREYLKEDIQQWKGKRVFEIGAGNGWLLQEAQNAGALEVCGIEPSATGVTLAKEAHPDISIEQKAFEEYVPEAHYFDVVVSVMVFSHIENLESAFAKVRALLSEKGEAILIVPDFEYFKQQRKNYVVSVQDIDTHQYVVQITRPTGTIADIVRANDVYAEEAKKQGLMLTETVAMVPLNEDSAGPAPGASAITQLLRFTVHK